MSKLYSIYLKEKEKNKDNILLFKSGIFFIALGRDAIFLSQLLNLKLTNLNDSVKKCGFPCSNLDKYLELFQIHQLDIKLIEIDKSVSYTISEYNQSKSIQNLLNQIRNVDVDNLSISEIYSFVEDLKQQTIKITELS